MEYKYPLEPLYNYSGFNFIKCLVECANIAYLHNTAYVQTLPMCKLCVCANTAYVHIDKHILMKYNVCDRKTGSTKEKRGKRKMVKVRFDIVVVTFLMVILVIFGNAFVNINRSFYKSMDEDVAFNGYPATEDTIEVTTMEELAEAEEEGDSFVIVVDPDNVKKTSYYAELNGSNKVEKMSRLSVVFNRAMHGSYYDRVYIVELEDGQFVPVLMMDGVIDLSGKKVTLPVGEVEFLSKKADYLEELGKKYDFSEIDSKQWYVNASGKDMTIFTDFADKAEALKTTNWAIIGVAVALYAVVSTVYIVKSRRKSA